MLCRTLDPGVGTFVREGTCDRCWLRGCFNWPSGYRQLFEWMTAWLQLSSESSRQAPVQSRVNSSLTADELLWSAAACLSDPQGGSFGDRIRSFPRDVLVEFAAEWLVVR
jgi:hypothetical protein